MKNTLVTRRLNSGHDITAGIKETCQGVMAWVSIDGKEDAEAYAVWPIRSGPLRKNGKVYTHSIGKVALTQEEAETIIAAQEAEKSRIETAEQNLIDKNVPGLDKVHDAARASANESDRYQSETEAMMHDGDNDGVNSPRARDKSLAKRATALRAEYPRASVYLRAKAYTGAANTHKRAAGKKAMEILASGANITDAEATLDNWVPANAAWD